MKKAPNTLTKRLLYLLLTLAFVAGFAIGLVVESSELFQGRFSIKGKTTTPTTTTTSEITGPDMATGSTDTTITGPDM